ncbi:MAG: hypothetical protein ACYC5O_17820, partial [Anaerolineae bacterium]
VSVAGQLYHQDRAESLFLSRLIANHLPSREIGASAEERFDVEAMPLLADDGRPPGERLFLVTSVTRGQPLQLELWAKNRSPVDRRYVVVPLVDYQQARYAGQELLYLEMPPATELFLPGQVPIPGTTGVHEVQFITIGDPYEHIADTYNPFVTSPMRSAVVVGDSQPAASAGTGSR